MANIKQDVQRVLFVKSVVDQAVHIKLAVRTTTTSHALNVVVQVDIRRHVLSINNQKHVKNAEKLMDTCTGALNTDLMVYVKNAAV